MRRTRKAAEDPNIRDVPAFAHGLSDKQLHCRELGHEWRHHTAEYDPKAQIFDRALRCRNCGTVRVQVLNRHGHVLRNGYKYTDGYLATKVMNREGLSRDVFRLEALTRIIETTTPKAV
jgi:hypothetical protein